MIYFFWVCVFVSVVIVYFLLRPYKADYTIAGGVGFLLEFLYRALLLIPLLLVWLIYFVIKSYLK